MMMAMFETAAQRRRRVLKTAEERRRMCAMSAKNPNALANAHAAAEKKRVRRRWLLTAAAAIGAVVLASQTVFASGFEIAVSPARFELSGKSAGRLGQSLDIYNVGATATEVSVRTLDWTYSEDGKLSFHDELQTGSCRPWVALERKVVQVPARGKKAFRFQVEPPADAERGQCRFMLAIEGVNPAHRALIEGGGASLSLPVSGRIAVAVYFNVNGAEPKLELREVTMANINGKQTPALRVHNSGDAHGRIDGGLEAKDAKGLEFEMAPDNSPILPGQTRLIALAPKAEGKNAAPVPVFPVTTKGTLDWDRGSFKVAAEFKQ